MAVHALKSNMRRAQSYTWATLPAIGLAGRMAWCTNFGTKGALLTDDGTRWKPVGTVTLASLDATIGPINNTETIGLQYQFPSPAMWALKDHLRLFLTMTKSGATDAGVLGIRVGTTGAISGGTPDTVILSSNLMSAANLATGVHQDYRLEDATHVQQLAGNSAAVSGYSVASNTIFAASVVISSAVANSLYFTVTIKSSSTNNTVSLIDAVLKYDPAGN